MLLSQIEYDILRPIYRGEPQDFNRTTHKDVIEYLLENRMIERIAEDENADSVEAMYRITPHGRQAYEECENYLLEERRKDDTLQTAKKANSISIWAIGVSVMSFLVALVSLILTFTIK